MIYQDKKLQAYATVYHQKKLSHGGVFKKVPKNAYKLRISQVIVLPPYQSRGLGKVLLQTMYDYYLKQKLCLEISVEDPSIDF